MVRQIWKDFWKVLNTDVNELFSPDAVEQTAKAGEVVFKFAETLEKSPDSTALLPLAGQINSLLDILNSPLGEIVEAALPFMSIATGILKFYVEKTRQEPSLELCVALVSQAAYLESLRQFLKQNPDLKTELDLVPSSQAVQKQIIKLGNKLEIAGEEFVLDEKEAENTLVCFHNSKLAHIFNQILWLRLQESGLEEEQAKLITERISRSTHRHFKRSLATIRDSVKELAAVYGEGWHKDLQAYLSLDQYLEGFIAQKPQEKVFNKDFTFEEIYVHLQVLPIEENGKIHYEASPENIETWVKNRLQEESKSGQVLFIQSGPGRGKSFFCRMFADLVRRELHPIWTPILIRLRDLKNLELNFDRTLEAAIGWDFARSNSGWLTDRNTRFLFILDGFDELLLQGGLNRALQQFLEQVALFQSRCAENPERGHRILITGRPFALWGIERLMPHNIERVTILPMDKQIQQQWLGRWEEILKKNDQSGLEKSKAFQNFLQVPDCLDEVQELVQEPLLMYFLAAMHRDNRLQGNMFLDSSKSEAKLLIYEEALEWVLRQRLEAGIHLNRHIKNLELEDFYSIFAESGLCVIQSGREYASLGMIKQRLELKEDKVAQNLIELAKRQQSERNQSGNFLQNLLADFYFKSSSEQDNSIEFLHKSFSEYLCAKRMVKTLIDWTLTTNKRRQPYFIATTEMEWQVYDLFGYGPLNQEIVEYIVAILDKQQLNFVLLFERLEDFYWRWCKGEYIEALENMQDTLPLRKSRQLQQQKIKRGQQDVEIYTGLNVLILLLELHRYGQTNPELQGKISFYPCGDPESNSFHRMHLFRIIGYTNYLSPFTFTQIVGKFLHSSDLRQVVFSGGLLTGSDFSNANLRSAYLSRAYLLGANFYKANLTGVDLTGAYLCGANLTGANLTNACLMGVDLTGADLTDTDLTGALLTGANLSNVRWSKQTKWSGAKNLHEAIEVPKVWLDKRVQGTLLRLKTR